jgi:hypothetical protein
VTIWRYLCCQTFTAQVTNTTAKSGSSTYEVRDEKDYLDDIRWARNTEDRGRVLLPNVQPASLLLNERS